MAARGAQPETVVRVVQVAPVQVVVHQSLLLQLIQLLVVRGEEQVVVLVVVVDGQEPPAINKEALLGLVVEALEKQTLAHQQITVIFQTVVGNLIRLWFLSDLILALEELLAEVPVALANFDIGKMCLQLHLVVEQEGLQQIQP